MNWYKGKTVMEFLDGETEPFLDYEKFYPVFIVQDRYDKIVVGMLEEGVLKTNQKVLILPQKQKNRIKFILNSSGNHIKKAYPNQTIGVDLVADDNISRGDVFTSLNHNLKISNKVEGNLFWIKKPQSVKLFVECGMNKQAGQLILPKTFIQGKTTYFKFKCEKPIVFSKKGFLGKVIIKEKGDIIGIGSLL